MDVCFDDSQIDLQANTVRRLKSIQIFIDASINEKIVVVKLC